MQYEIITDSAANLPEDMIVKYQLGILSLSFFVDGKEYNSYEKGKTTDLAQFYQMMRDKKNITTSLVNAGRAMEMCEAYLQEEKDLLYIGFSSGLSGTFQSVSVGLKMLQEKYPERKIIYIDSLAAALGEGLLVYYACRMREEGRAMEEVGEWLEDHKLRLCHWFTVDDLFFLKRGGRVSAATAVLGTALSIKPVMHVDNEGHLTLMEKVRGRKKSLDSLILHFEDSVEHPEGQAIFISHGDCQEDAEYVANRIKEKYPVGEVVIRILDPVIGSHAGPGTVALFYLGRNR